jgi:hypothetical protein
MVHTTQENALHLQEFGDFSPILTNTIFPAVVARFRARHAEHMSYTVDKYLMLMEQHKVKRQFNFSLLTGETQSGKTIAMHFLSWILIYKYGYVPCYITKKNTALRSDALDKLALGMVNEIVKEVCEEHGYSERAKDISLFGSVGIKTDMNKYNEIPIFLMEPANNVKVLRWMRDLASLPGKPRHPVFFFDEVQELYTTCSKVKNKGGGGTQYNYLKNNGFMKGQTATRKLSNHMLIHEIARCCKELSCGMIGVTATPQRVLSSDPEVYPDHIYRLPCVSPGKGLKRVGYNDSGTEEFQNATFHTETDIVTIIREIIARKPITLSTGDRQIKFLNITTDHYNSDMASVHGIITENYDRDQVYVKLFIQDTPDYSDINISKLDDFFDLRDIPDTVIQNGLVVLIGKSREGAGVTIKPSFKLQKEEHHKTEIKDIQYIIDGITDMRIKLPDNMETADQLLGRATGWFDAKHEMHIWIAKSQLHDAKTGLIKTKNSIIAAYDGSQGPKSVIEVSNMCTSITKFSTNDNYTCHAQQKGKIAVIPSQFAETSHQLQTIIKELPTALHVLFKEAQVAEGGGNSKCGKKFLKKVHDIVRPILGLTVHTQICWSAPRYKDIVKAVAQPEDSSQWKINAYVFEDTSTGTDSLKLVCFIKPHDKRPCFGYNCDGCLADTCDKPMHQSMNDTIQWHDGVKFNSATFSRHMTHKYAKTLTNWKLSDEHDKVLQIIRDIIAECADAIRKKNLWIIFKNLHTLNNCNRFRPKAIHYSKWIADRWKDFKETHANLYETLQAVLATAHDQETNEDDILVKLNTLMTDYFAESFRSKGKGPKPPVIKIKARVKSR